MNPEVQHIDAESLERYALGRSLESESEPIEEHLLICGPCRDELSDLDRFIPAVRDALRKFAARPAPG
jgi:hypothetical protein